MLQTPGGADTKYEEIHIASPPCMVDLIECKQRIILDADIAVHHDWLVRFSDRKALVVDHDHDVLPGNPNVKWYATPAPSRLPYFLSRLPDSNSAHVLHSSVFVQPTVELYSRNMTSLAPDLTMNLTKANPVCAFLSALLEETHTEDIKIHGVCQIRYN